MDLCLTIAFFDNCPSIGAPSVKTDGNGGIVTTEAVREGVQAAMRRSHALMT